jgi:CubicO group peptidase (beta-lactamase class C family)
MRKVILTVLATLLVLAIWTGGLVFGMLEGFWRPPLAPRGDARAFAAAADAMITGATRGNVVFALITDGRITHERFSSIGAPVGRDTLFQAASLSKWITALGVMTLVDAGRVDLDAPVGDYLRRWRLPPSQFDNRQVTVRRLLSHTAGLTDGLGYGGFPPGRPVQPLVESLTQAADAEPGEGAVRVGIEPGSEWRYSGGGYALLQLMIEDVTGESFDSYMRRAVLAPLGMTRSSFAAPQAVPDLAASYDTVGRPTPLLGFSAPSAVGLNTSAADLTRLIQAHLPGPAGEPPGRGVLRPATLELMRRPHAFQYGGELWGLGVVIYSPNNAGGHIVGHDGSNTPAINTAARFNPANGDGIVVLETGNPNLATQVAAEWVYWQTGHVDVLSFPSQFRRTLPILAGGWLVILLAAITIGWRFRRRRTATPAP